MFDLYEQGLGTHSIAKKIGRSTHTVHSVLTQRGTRTLPERNTEVAQEGSEAVPVEVAGDADAGSGTMPVHLTGAGI